jgi:hypothetical protein
MSILCIPSFLLLFRKSEGKAGRQARLSKFMRNCIPVPYEQIKNRQSAIAGLQRPMLCDIMSVTISVMQLHNI